MTQHTASCPDAANTTVQPKNQAQIAKHLVRKQRKRSAISLKTYCLTKPGN